MSCLPGPLLAWFLQMLQPITSSLDNDGWDYGGNQEIPPDMQAQGSPGKHFPIGTPLVFSFSFLLFYFTNSRFDKDFSQTETIMLPGTQILPDIQIPQKAAIRISREKDPGLPQLPSVNFSRPFLSER